MGRLERHNSGDQGGNEKIIIKKNISWSVQCAGLNVDRFLKMTKNSDDEGLRHQWDDWKDINQDIMESLEK